MSAVKALERLGTAAVLLGGAASAVQLSMYDGKLFSSRIQTRDAS